MSTTTARNRLGGIFGFKSYNSNEHLTSSDVFELLTDLVVLHHQLLYSIPVRDKVKCVLSHLQYKFKVGISL